MVAVPMKPEYGPTLGRLLAPRWHALSRTARIAAIAAGAVALLGVVAIALTLLDASYSHGGSVPFSFRYRDLYRVAPDPGGYVKVQKRSGARGLEYSFAVDPLKLPAYGGDLSGELPLYAAGYIDRLRARDPGFVLRGEGKTRIGTMLGYDVLYTEILDGRELYGRDVLLLPEHAGVRDGVDIVMLTAAGASKQVDGPIEVATAGPLEKPLKSFSFG